VKLLRRTLIFINGILILSLLFGYLRQFTDPGQGSFLTIFSLLYPYIVILLCICLVLLLLIRSRWLWASLLALVLTSGNTIRQIGFHIQPDIPVDSTVYTLSTLNIKNNFRHKKMDQSTAFIEDFKKKNSTFLVLQEISGDQIRNIANALKLFNIHLHTNAVTVRAEKFTPESFSKKEGLRAFNDMLRAYSENASLRLDEIRLINSEVNHSPYPVILAGDANDTPYSPVYRSLRGNRQNAFVKGGLGFAQTYNGLIVPLKIDHIFLDKTFFVYNTTIEKIDYSDHNPITTSFSLIRSHLTANY